MPHTVLITGAAGFVGSHLLQLLSTADPAPCIVAWRRPLRADRSAPPRVFDELSNIRWRAVDLLDRDDVTASVEDCRPAVVYHLAGVAGVHGSWNNNLATLDGNVRGTQHLIGALERGKREVRLLIPGSALVYKPSSAAISEDHEVGPVSPYGLSKLAQEMLGRHASRDDLQVLLTRSFTHLGPGQDPTYAASSFAYQIARIEKGDQEPVIRVGFLGARRDLTDVRDTVRAYAALMAEGIAGRPYNVCAGRAYTIEKVLDRLIAQARVPVGREPDETRLRPNDNLLLLGDPRRIHDQTGWKAEIPLDRTLRDLLDYWRGAVSDGWHHTHLDTLKEKSDSIGEQRANE